MPHHVGTKDCIDAIVCATVWAAIIDGTLRII